VDENSTAITVTDSTTETALATLTLPALTISSAGAARISAVGVINANSTGSVIFKVIVSDDSLTATVLQTTGIQVASSANPHPWVLEGWFVGKQPNQNRAWGDLSVGKAAVGASLAPSTYSSVGFSTMGLDETETWTVEVSAKMSSASTSYSVTGHVAILEGIN
jgi:hypothetical protein